MTLHVDHGAAAAPYDQIRTQIAEQVKAGQLQPGERLPTVRGLADELGVAVNTVAKAYRELELAGVIETRGRAGSFVTGNRRDGAAREAAVEYVARVRTLGVTDAEALALVERVLSH